MRSLGGCKSIRNVAEPTATTPSPIRLKSPHFFLPTSQVKETARITCLLQTFQRVGTSLDSRASWILEMSIASEILWDWLSGLLLRRRRADSEDEEAGPSVDTRNWPRSIRPDAPIASVLGRRTAFTDPVYQLLTRGNK
jgi:hypothetical protein